MPAHLGDATCTEDTKHAVKVHVFPTSDTDYWAWIPKSVLDDESEIQERGDEGSLFVRTWFAEREGYPHD